MLIVFNIAYTSNGIGFYKNLDNLFGKNALIIVILICSIPFIGLIIVLVKMARDERLYSSEWFFEEYFGDGEE